MSRTIRIAAIATLVTQIVIVGTGGAVRLTGSGLGCSTWPNCTPESFVPVPEQGIHGIIEFSNRVMGGVTIAVALWMVIMAWKHRRAFTGVLSLALWVLGLTFLQALIGAVVVFLHLTPNTVGLHFVISAILVGIAAWMLWRVFQGVSTGWSGTPLQRWLTAALVVLMTFVVGLGILTTGSGPHAGDAIAERNGLNSELLQHFHAIPAYGLFAVTLALALLSRGRGPHGKASLVLTAVLTAQIIVGLIQSNTGLPVGLVGIHMVLSVVSVSAATMVVLGLRELPRASDSPKEPATIAV